MKDKELVKFLKREMDFYEKAKLQAKKDREHKHMKQIKKEIKKIEEFIVKYS
jgi:hypothetical protein